jgi:hypothetical protein
VEENHTLRNGAVAVARPPGKLLGVPGPREAGGPSLRDIDLRYDAWGRLVLVDAHGREHVGVEPVRAFPISAPRHGISLLDAEGHELLWINDLDQVPRPIRELIEHDLARREFMPVLRRIVKVSAQAEPCEWQVETDRGPTRFVLGRDDDVRRLAEHGALITDSHGIRYLIPDLRTLDAASRRFLERYL